MTKRATEPKQTTSFRYSEELKGKLDELSNLFDQNTSAILERAINYLYDSRESIARQEFEQRLKKIIK